MARLSEPISVRFSTEVRQKISTLAQREGIDQGAMIRRLVKQALVTRVALGEDEG